jgi:peptidoglycan/LPS O-acetylase OafA/YrhL
MAFSRSLGWVSFDTKDLLASIFYVRNLWPGPVSVLQHTWSLAVEEQFYIIWPVCMVLLARRHWPGLVAIGLVAKFILRLVVTAGYPNGQAALISTGFDAICCGVAIALWMDGREGKPAIFEPSSAFSRFDLVPVLCVGCLFVLYDKAYLWSGRATVLEPLLRDVLVGTLLLYCISRTSGVLIGVLTSRWLVGIGLVSYSMYLWQQPFFVGKFDTWSDVVLRFPFFAAASLLSYFLVERTGLRLKRHFSADPGRMRPN